jgi:hypothetical protein
MREHYCSPRWIAVSAFAGIVLVLGPQPSAQRFSAWSSPTNLGPTINTPSFEG